MGRKKKKRPSTEASSTSSPAIVVEASVETKKKPLLVLELTKTTTTPSSKRQGTPNSGKQKKDTGNQSIVVLSSVDADRLQVQEEDVVFVLALSGATSPEKAADSTISSPTLSNITLCRVEVSVSNGRNGAVAPGSCRMRVNPEATFPPSGPVHIVAWHSALGRRLQQSLCCTARTVDLVIENENLSASIQQSKRLFGRLFVAHCSRAQSRDDLSFLRHGDTLRISFQGRPVRVKVVDMAPTLRETSRNDGSVPGAVGGNQASPQGDASGGDDSVDIVSVDENDAAERLEEEELLEAVTLLLVNAASETEKEDDVHRAHRLLFYRVSSDTQVNILPPPSLQDSDGVVSSTTDTRVQQTTTVDHVAGLDSVLDQVRSILSVPLKHQDNASSSRPSNSLLNGPRGVLLHGPSGVGKSALAQQVAAELAASSEVHVEYVHGASLQAQTSIVGQAERTLTRIFQKGRRLRQRCVLILDDVHSICPKRGSSSVATDRLAATLLSLMDSIGMNSPGSSSSIGSREMAILAITSDPSLLDPALRRPGRLDVEIEVPIPDQASRAAILQFHLERFCAGSSSTDTATKSILPSLTKDEWMELGKLAKGFTGADCMLAVKEAIQTAVLRRHKGDNRPPNADASIPNGDGGPSSDTQVLQLQRQDLVTSIRATKPSAIKSITVEIPQVQWSSIGGMDSVKEELREAINLPLTHSELLSQLGVPPPRGILLYGPPGCSKTLMARALATEGSMNFLAVKGPELLSKWLGESERALASLFRRARMASPSIIFFDEIDAIATKRGSGDSASSGRLLSQLLTELDGVNHTGSSSAVSKKKPRVVVVGATNRPDLLDSALTRPGRIDRMIYVGVPDTESRARIIEISLQDKYCGDGIEVQELAQATQGFSGAEMVAICRNAALLALEESCGDMSTSKAVEPRLEMRHLKLAVQGMKRRITPDMLEFYESFRAKSSSSKII